MLLEKITPSKFSSRETTNFSAGCMDSQELVVSTYNYWELPNNIIISHTLMCQAVTAACGASLQVRSWKSLLKVAQMFNWGTWMAFHDQQDSHGARKHRESTQLNSSKTAKLFFFLLSSFFRRASSILRQPLALVYARNSSIFTEQCTTPSLFHNFEVSQGARSHSLKHYGFQFGTPFSLFVLAHAHLKIT